MHSVTPGPHIVLELPGSRVFASKCLALYLEIGDFEVPDVLSNEFRHGVDHKISHFFSLARLADVQE